MTCTAATAGFIPPMKAELRPSVRVTLEPPAPLTVPLTVPVPAIGRSFTAVRISLSPVLVVPGLTVYSRMFEVPVILVLTRRGLDGHVDGCPR